MRCQSKARRTAALATAPRYATLPTVIPDDYGEPIELFEHYFAQAKARTQSPYDATAVALATADASGRPALRMVLLKGVQSGGFLFFTNYSSRKGGDLAENPRAALCFHFVPIGIQVRIEGSVAQLSAGHSDAYFQSRPRGSQLGAWASLQSSTLNGRDELLARYRDAEQRFAEKPVPRPDYWGGYRLEPCRIEFWAEEPSRLHDRLVYERDPAQSSSSAKGPVAGKPWQRSRLYP